MTTVRVLRVVRLLVRLLLALLNQGEWMGAEFGCINLLTGAFKLPSGGVDLAVSLVGGALTITSVNWQSLTGSISLWGG